MQVFVSWSGESSKAIATALTNWLPDVIQSMDVWMSEHDIAAGSKWSEQISDVLEKSNIGIICLTPDNQNSPWILFEAGCLAKTNKIARVTPFLHGLSATDVRFPLAQFQSVAANKEGTLKLLQSLNVAGGVGMSSERLEKLFEKWWPDLEQQIARVDVGSMDESSERSDRELLEEVLDLVRNGAKLTRAEMRRSRATSYLKIDVSELFGEEGLNFDIPYDASENVSDFLDRLYFGICKINRIPAYEYGTFWLLKDQQSGRVFDNIGIRTSKSRGDVRETQSVYSEGITEDSLLAVFKPTR